MYKGIVSTLGLMFLHIPAVLVAGPTTISAAEVPLPCVHQHVSHQVALELGDLSTHLASVLLLIGTTQGQHDLLNILLFIGARCSGTIWSCHNHLLLPGHSLQYLKENSIKIGFKDEGLVLNLCK